MDVRYFIDPQTGQPHIYGHDVSEPEVEAVLGSPGEDRGALVLTAYDLTGKAAMAFRRRRRS